MAPRDVYGSGWEIEEVTQSAEAPAEQGSVSSGESSCREGEVGFAVSHPALPSSTVSPRRRGKHRYGCPVLDHSHECGGCARFFVRSEFRWVMLGGKRRLRCPECATAPRKPPPCPECCGMPWRRTPHGCIECREPYADEEPVGLDHDRRLPSALVMVMR